MNMADILEFPSQDPPLIKRVDLAKDEVVLSLSQFLSLLREKTGQGTECGTPLGFLWDRVAEDHET